MKLIFTLFLILIINKFSYSNEYVTNGSFEEFSTLPLRHSELNKSNFWTSSTMESDEFTVPGSSVLITSWNHSPDYLDHRTYMGPFNNIPVKEGTGMVGMFEYEMIRQNLGNPLSKFTQYVFSMYIRGTNALHRDQTTLKIYLSEDEPKYGEDGSKDHGCREDYSTISADKLHSIFSIPLSDATFDDLGNNWIHVTFVFTPAEKGSFYSNAVYNWLCIQTELNTPSTYYDPNGSCISSYILIDQVSIMDLCDNMCVNDLPSLAYYIFQGGQKVFDTYTNSIGVGPHGPQIFSTFIKDATYVYLEFLDRFSHTIYQYEAMDPKGLKDIDPNTGQIFEDFLLFWDGKRTEGNTDCETFSDVYNGFLIIKNCNRTVDVGISATIVNAPTSCTPKNSHYSISFDNCCPNDADIENHTYSSNDRVDVNDYINIGLTGQVNISQYASVKFHAGNEINSGQYLYIAQGAEAEFKIVPCGTFRKRKYNSRETIKNLTASNDLTIYPQPAATFCNLTSQKNILKVNLRTIDNSELKDFSVHNFNNVKLDLTDVVAGIYLLYIQYTDGKIECRKIAIVK